MHCNRCQASIIFAYDVHEARALKRSLDPSAPGFKLTLPAVPTLAVMHIPVVLKVNAATASRESRMTISAAMLAAGLAEERIAADDPAEMLVGVRC